MPSPLARRAPAVAVVALTVAAGLALRSAVGGPVGGYGGVALYAVMVHGLLRVVRPGATPARTAVLALAACWAVELAQLTPWPAAASEHSRPARLVLGSSFDPWDLAAYAAGVLPAFVVHRWWTRRGGGSGVMAGTRPRGHRPVSR